MADLNEFQSKIGYTFKNRHLLEQALTHSSYANEKHMKKHSDNERLEFLGDAVLEIVSSEFLFINYPQKPEGELTKLRASIVCEPTLALCTKPLDLGKYLRLGRGEDHTGGRKRKSILSDALEAVIGAIYLDGGFTNAKEFVLRFIMTDIENKQLFYDSKTILQELIQGRHEQLSYELIDESVRTMTSSLQLRCLWTASVSAREKATQRRRRSSRLHIRHFFCTETGNRSF